MGEYITGIIRGLIFLFAAKLIYDHRKRRLMNIEAETNKKSEYDKYRFLLSACCIFAFLYGITSVILGVFLLVTKL